MEWLKDKKNMPIVAGLIVFLLVAAGIVIAWETGAFGGSAPIASAPGVSGGPSAGIPPGGFPGGSPGGMVPGGPPGMPGRQSEMPMGIPRGVSSARSAAATAATVVKKPVNTNPAVGPDPFQIPNGAQKIANINKMLAGPKLPLRDAIGPLNLFQIHPPSPPPAPVLPDVIGGQGGGNTVTADPASHYRLSGIINGADGINAIIEVDGQSQSVKPGDSLPDGTKVTNIQATSVTLRTNSGAALNLQLSAGTPDQGNAQGNNFNGQAPFQPGFPQQGQNL